VVVAPNVTVHLPESRTEVAAPIVNVAAPEVRAEAPVVMVNVDPTPISVNVSPTPVEVRNEVMPAAVSVDAPVTVNVPAATPQRARFSVRRDEAGRIAEVQQQ
jgi:hypothetical protein